MCKIQDGGGSHLGFGVNIRFCLSYLAHRVLHRWFQYNQNRSIGVWLTAFCRFSIWRQSPSWIFIFTPGFQIFEFTTTGSCILKMSLISVDWLKTYSTLSFRDFITGIPYYGQKMFLGDLTPKTLDNDGRFWKLDAGLLIMFHCNFSSIWYRWRVLDHFCIPEMTSCRFRPLGGVWEFPRWRILKARPRFTICVPQ